MPLCHLQEDIIALQGWETVSLSSARGHFNTAGITNGKLPLSSAREHYSTVVSFRHLQEDIVYCMDLIKSWCILKLYTLGNSSVNKSCKFWIGNLYCTKRYLYLPYTVSIHWISIHAIKIWRENFHRVRLEQLGSAITSLKKKAKTIA